MSTSLIRLTLGIALTAAVCAPAQAQGLNWEGQTGGMVTPTASVSESEPGRVGRPALAFHLLNGGDVISTHFRLSLTTGIADRLEVGYTRAAVSSGDGVYSTLFDRGFSTVHGKVKIVPERANGIPAISAGVAARWQLEHLEGALGVATQNADIYVVGTKTFAAGEQASVQISGGAKITKASLLGLAGNAPEWTPTGFLSGAVTLADTVLLGGEWLQHPAGIEGIPGADVPATTTLFARFNPDGRVSVDAALVRLADIAEGIDLRAKRRFIVGASYRF